LALLININFLPDKAEFLSKPRNLKYKQPPALFPYHFRRFFGKLYLKMDFLLKTLVWFLEIITN